MALRYFLNIGPNWGDTANWSDTSGGTGGFSVPTSADDVIFDGNSGDCIVNATGRVCKTIDFTNYTNTITMTNTITVSGNVTLGSGMSIAGSANLIINETSTITSNGKSWDTGLILGSNNNLNKTYTLVGNLTVLGSVKKINGGNAIISSNTLFIGGSFDTDSVGINIQGTTNIVMNGTGAVGNSSYDLDLRLPFTINTTGTITFIRRLRIGVNLIYVAGNIVINPGHELYYTAAVTLDTSTIVWNIINFTNPNSSSAVTLLSDLRCGGTFYAGGSSNTNTYNTTVGAKIIVTGNLIMGSTGGITGTADLEIVGTGDQSWSGAGPISTNLTIDKPSGTLSIFGEVRYSTKLFRYISGDVDVGTSSLRILSTTTVQLDIGGIRWNTLTLGTTAAATITLLSDITCNSVAFTSNNALTITVNGFSITTSFISLGFVSSGNYTYTAGTTKFILVGQASVNYSITQLGILGNTIEIDCEQITFPNSLRFGSSSNPQIIYKKGVVKGLRDLVGAFSFTLNDISALKNLVSIRMSPNQTLTLNNPIIGHPLNKISVLATSVGTFNINCTKRFVNRYVRIKDAISANINNKIFIGENKYNESSNFAETSRNDFVYRMNEIPNGVPTTYINNDPMLENKDYRSFDPMFTIR